MISQEPTPQSQSTARAGGGLDLYATLLSTLCLLHCLATPLLIALLPVLGSWLGDHLVHQLLVLAAAPATLLILRATGPRGDFIWLALGGLFLLVVAAFVEALEPWETPITVAGSLALATAHGRRWLTRPERRLEAPAASVAPAAAQAPTPAKETL